MKIVKTLAGVIILMMPLLAVAQTLKVGIVAPVDPTLYWEMRELKVSAQLAEERLKKELKFDIEIVILENNLENEIALKHIKQKIEDEGIIAIMGGVTQTSAQVLRYAGSYWKIPTVVITSPTLEGQTQGRNRYVLDLGVSEQEIHREILRHWKEKFKLDKISIIYNADYSLPSEYGSIAKNVLFDNSNNSKLEIKWSDNNLESQEDKIVKMVDEKPDGIVLSGPPWDTNQWINTISGLGIDVRFYIAPPLSGLSEMNALAHRSKAPVYSGSQYWTNPRASNELDFTKETIKSLGWTQKWPMSPVALRVYDALTVIIKAASENRFQAVMDHWWKGLSEVYGIKGKLIHYNDTTLSPESAYLLEIKTKDEVVFYDKNLALNNE